MKLVSIKKTYKAPNSLKKMDNKKAGYLLLASVVLIVIIIFMYNSALQNIINANCSLEGHGDSCTMQDTLSKQTNLSIVLAGLVAIVALFLILSKPQEKIILKTKTIKEKQKKKEYNLSNLKPEEKKAFNLIKDNKTIFQADLIEKMQIGKAKMSRILDRLEGKGFIERKRRGMTNIVVLKE